VAVEVALGVVGIAEAAGADRVDPVVVAEFLWFAFVVGDAFAD